MLVGVEGEGSLLLSVSLDEPQLEGFGPTRHTSYRVTSHLPTHHAASGWQASGSKSGSPPSSSTRHRFSEFVKLRDDLYAAAPGILIPPLPSKSVINRFAKEFIEKRRCQLALFLQRVVEHPLAASLPPVLGFMGWGEEIRALVIKRAREVLLPPPPPDDTGDPLVDAAKMATELQAHLQKTRTVAKRLTSRREDEGMDLIELSQSVQQLGEHGMNGALHGPMAAFAQVSSVSHRLSIGPTPAELCLIIGITTTSSPYYRMIAAVPWFYHRRIGLEQLASVTRRQAEEDKISRLLEALKLYKQLAIALQEQFTRRSALAKTIETISAKLIDLQSTRLAGKPGKEKKVAELEQTAGAVPTHLAKRSRGCCGRELKLKIEQHREQHVLFSRTMLWELERFNRGKNAELHGALVLFAQVP
ncbi:MAG: hypothetical protein SGPRY_006392 [Prymnesium sp.]